MLSVWIASHFIGAISQTDFSFFSHQVGFLFTLFINLKKNYQTENFLTSSGYWILPLSLELTDNS